jgi:hypothetical protein
MNSGVMLDGRWSHPKKSLPGQVPYSRAFCAAFTCGSKAFTAPASKKQAAFVMSSLMLFIIVIEVIIKFMIWMQR